MMKFEGKQSRKRRTKSVGNFLTTVACLETVTIPVLVRTVDQASFRQEIIKRRKEKTKSARNTNKTMIQAHLENLTKRNTTKTKDKRLSHTLKV